MINKNATSYLVNLLISAVLLCVVISQLTFAKNQDSKGITETSIPLALNLQQKEQDLVNAKVTVLYIWSKDCPFCKQLENEVLIPNLLTTNNKQNLLLKKLELGSKLKLLDFKRIETTTDKLLKEFDVSVTPTILFLSPAGVEISKRIVGYNGAEFYWYYFNKAIDESNRKLQENTP